MLIFLIPYQLVNLFPNLRYLRTDHLSVNDSDECSI